MSKDYVGICKCGGLVFWVAEKRASGHRKDIARLLKDGFSIERMDTEEARQAEFCKNRGKCKEKIE